MADGAEYKQDSIWCAAGATTLIQSVSFDSVSKSTLRLSILTHRLGGRMALLG